MPMTSLQDDRANKQRGGDARCTTTIVENLNTPSTVTCDDNQHHIKRIQLRPNLGDLMQRYKNSIPQAAKHNGPAALAKEAALTKRHRRGVSSQRHRSRPNQPSEDPSVKIVRIERVTVHTASCNTVSPMSINESLLGNTQERKKLVLKLRELLRLQYPDHQSTNPNAIFVKARDCLNQTGNLPSKICGLTESLDMVLTCVHCYAVFGGTFESARSTPVN